MLGLFVTRSIANFHFFQRQLRRSPCHLKSEAGITSTSGIVSHVQMRESCVYHLKRKYLQSLIRGMQASVCNVIQHRASNDQVITIFSGMASWGPCAFSRLLIRSIRSRRNYMYNIHCTTYKSFNISCNICNIQYSFYDIAFNLDQSPAGTDHRPHSIGP